jgi:hypothetical protein
LFNDLIETIDWATNHIGSKEYQYWDSHPDTIGRLENIFKYFGFGKSNKCNVFVNDALKAGGIAPPKINGRAYVTSEWANTKINISHYKIVKNLTIFSLKKGDIISDGHHMGIYNKIFGSYGTISASAKT